MRLQRTLVLVLFACGLSASAQMVMDPAGTPFSHEMDASMKRMDHDMTAAPMTGDVDHDFVVMMLPHHQGAIDMAKGELRYGKDPSMRRLAEKIIADQQSEIDVMNLWLKEHAAAETKPR